MIIPTQPPKPPKPARAAVGRRAFLITTTLAGLTTGAAMTGAVPAFASALAEDQSATLLQMVQDIFPHPDFLPVSIYEAVLNGVLTEADEQEETATLLLDGLEDLNARAAALHGVAYAEVDEYVKREALLRIIQDSDFFQKLRWATWAGIYINPEAWPQFGYEGSSWEQGGYIDRGFSDATWIPPGPTLEERLKAVGR